MNRVHQFALSLILIGYLVLATVYSLVTPIFEASDELWHYPMVETLAANGLSLPVQNPAIQTAWRQEGSQPPLYYFAAAILTSGIDTSDLSAVRRINPHADIGTLPPDRNVNMIVHRTDLEAFAWRGTTLAVHIARFFSILLGLGTVIVTALLARALFPDQPIIMLGATALNAFLPMFLFISGSVNNDNASNLLGNLITLLIVRLLQRRKVPSLFLYAIMGLTIGLGLLTKLNTAFLIPIYVFALIIISARYKSLHPILVGGLISGGLCILIAGWWYVRNIQLYGDPTGLNVFLDIVGRRAIPADLQQLWVERYSFSQAFWGFFGGMNVALPLSVYRLFDGIAVIGIIGTFAFWIRVIISRSSKIARWLPALVTLVWIVATFISYVRWTAETPASQGRLLFGSLSSICIWITVGCIWWLPKRAQPLVVSGIALGFFSVSLIAPFTVIQPAYALPEALPHRNTQASFKEPGGIGEIGLIDYSIETEQIQPDNYVHLVMDWQVNVPMSRDYSMFVHLESPDGVVIAQRDMYPGGGTLATSDLETLYAWRNPVAIRVPTTAYAPMPLSVTVGWYDHETGERLLINGEEKLMLGTVELVPRPADSAIPNPISIKLSDQAELIGYEISDLSPQPGDAIEVTLYWRRLQEMRDAYVVFVQLIDRPTLTNYGASDAQPSNWTAPTNTWQAGDIIQDIHRFVVEPNTPPAIYDLQIGMYLQNEAGQFNRLRIVDPHGAIATDYAVLTRMRVLPIGIESP